MCRGIPVHITIDNNDGVQETLAGNGTTHDTNMTLFQAICEGLFWSLLENLTLISAFNMFEMRVKRSVCSIEIFWFFCLFPVNNLFTETSIHVSLICYNRYCKDTGDLELFYFYSAYSE